MMGLKKLLTAASAVVLLGAAAQSQAATTVFTELALLMDVSGSVNATEFALQRNGYVNAFNNPILHNLIANNTNGLGIAVSFVQWSGANQQSQLGGTGTWYHLTNAATSQQFATDISNIARAFSGQTAPGSAINFITPQFGTTYDGIRKVIDVSGDGAENDGANTSLARNSALLAGINQINGLVILGQSGLEAWYNANVKGGTNSFVLTASTFNDFEAALLRKLEFEITGVIPVPAALPLLASGLLAFGFLARRRQAAA
jgi:hypothetical protein